MTNLNTVKEIQAYALSLGLTLSYKTKDGKRKRYTKSQLLELIESKNNKLDFSSMYGANVTSCVLEEVHEIEQKTNLNTVVNEVRSLLKIGKLTEALEKVNKLNNEIRNERKNKLLVTLMSQRLTILKALLKSKKVGGNLV
jgi:glutamate synthase domain-containing protein 1